MTKYVHTPLLILISSFFISCVDEENESERFTLTQGQKISFRLDSVTSFSPFSSDYIEGHYCTIDRSHNTLKIYNVEQEKLAKTVSFEATGPDGVGRLFGLRVISLDSILLFPQSESVFYLVDTSGAILDYFSYNPPEDLENAFVRNMAYTTLPQKVNENELLMVTRIGGNLSNVTSDQLASTPLSFTYNFSTGSTEITAHTYPEKYLVDGMKFFNFSMTASPDKIVYSFFADHHLYYAVNTNTELQKKSAKSRYFEDRFPTYPFDGTTEEKAQYRAASQNYKGLFYDMYRDVFYRFCFPQIDIQEQSVLRELFNYPKKFSIMILDKDLNIIGEKLFEDQTFWPYNHFVGRKGLYLSTDNPSNPDITEDKMQFQLLELTKMK